MDSLPAFYTVDDLAAAFRKKPRTIREMYRRGRIPGMAVGNTIQFTEEHVSQITEILSAASPFAKKQATDLQPASPVLTKTSRKQITGDDRFAEVRARLGR